MAQLPKFNLVVLTPLFVLISLAQGVEHPQLHEPTLTYQTDSPNTSNYTLSIDKIHHKKSLGDYEYWDHKNNQNSIYIPSQPAAIKSSDFNAWQLLNPKVKMTDQQINRFMNTLAGQINLNLDEFLKKYGKPIREGVKILDIE